MSAAAPLVVIGVGNVLLSDDAIGVRVVEALRVRAAGEPAMLPAGTRLVDGGTMGADLAGIVRGCRGLVLVDAVRTGGRAGDVTVLHDEGIRASGTGVDGGSVDGVVELLAVARLMRWLPEEVSLVGIEAAEVALGLHLSTAVEAGIPAAMDAVVEELRRMDATASGLAAGDGDAWETVGAKP